MEYSDDYSSDDNIELSLTKQKKKDRRIRRSGIEWSLESMERLIENVKQFESLWNPKHPSYKDRETNPQAWEAVAIALQLPKQEVVVKWNAMRSNYRVGVFFFFDCCFSISKSVS